MTYDFRSFATVFQSYQEMEVDVCNGTQFTVEKILSQVGI